MKRKQRLVYIADPEYVIGTMPGYLQKSYMQGHGYVEIRPSLDRESDDYRIRPCSVQLYLEECERLRESSLRKGKPKKARDAWQKLQDALELERQIAEEAAAHKEQIRKIKKMNRHIRGYLLYTGLAKEAKLAGVGLNWLYIKQ